MFSNEGSRSGAFLSDTYTANKLYPTLMFTGEGGGNDFYTLDSVSVVDTSSPSIELLDNPGFDNSSGALNGWNQWCDANCGGNQGTAVVIKTTGCQSNKCLSINCSGGPTAVYILTQTFSATIGRVYNITFWLKYSGGGGGFMRVDII